MPARSTAIHLLLCLAPCASLFVSIATAQQGAWRGGFTHPGWPGFSPIDLAVIPATSASADPSHVVVAWDAWYRDPSLNGDTVPWPQRFVVGDPDANPPVFANRTVTVPLGPNGIFYGDLFCAGHAWLPNGKLLVAGGNSRYEKLPTHPGFHGSQLIALWDPQQANQPPNYGWDWSLAQGASAVPMALKRWYPTVIVLSDQLVMIAGGAVDTSQLSQDPAMNTYEIFNYVTRSWVTRAGNQRLFPGPSTYRLDYYPRLTLLSTNKVLMTGGTPGATTVTPLTASWSPITHETQPPLERITNSVVPVPNVGNNPALFDMVMSIGGGQYGSTTTTAATRIFFSALNAWGENQPLPHQGRMVANAVLAPNGDVICIGGSANYYWQGASGCASQTPVRTTATWNMTRYAQGWLNDGAQDAARMYHSTAALLPSGRVVSGGSDCRQRLSTGTSNWDWEIYEPRYFAAGGTAASFAGAWAAPGPQLLTWNTTYQIPHLPMPEGTYVARVVLMRPCSVTHHSDMDQRYIELPSTPNATHVTATTPPAPNYNSNSFGATIMLPGWYMAFLVTNTGRPSTAKWVRVQ